MMQRVATPILKQAVALRQRWRDSKAVPKRAGYGRSKNGAKPEKEATPQQAMRAAQKQAEKEKDLAVMVILDSITMRPHVRLTRHSAMAKTMPEITGIPSEHLLYEVWTLDKWLGKTTHMPLWVCLLYTSPSPRD